MQRCRIATFNVKNLFLPAGSAGTPAIVGALPKRRQELKALARGLELAGADVVALQEVGSLQALRAVNELLQKPYPHLTLLPGNSRRGIHVAYASRFPARSRSHRHLPLEDETGRMVEDFASSDEAAAGITRPQYLQRDLLRLDLEFGAVPLTLFNVHLKSPNQPRWARLDAPSLRLAEVRLIARIVGDYARSHPEAAVVLLGDFNDEWPSLALGPLREAGLVRVTGPAGAPASFWPLGVSIDHVLVNARAGALVAQGSYRVIDDKRVRRGSDHCPVALDLDLSAAAVADQPDG